MEFVAITACKILYFKIVFHYYGYCPIFDFKLIRLSTIINTIPPIIPVITPIGNSFGRIIVRAIVSHKTR